MGGPISEPFNHRHLIDFSVGNPWVNVNGFTLCIRGNSSREWRAVLKSVDIVIATPSNDG